VDAGFLVRGLVWYFVFLFSTTAHEAAHAWAAQRGGDSTAYLGGQVSFDPIPHIRREPFGMLIVPILSFLLNQGTWMIGWASAPYDLAWALRHPTRAAWMAIAGPAANLTIAIGASLLLRAGVGAGAAAAPGGLGEGAAIGVSMILSLAVLLNLVLFFFNLIPIPPLDGGSALGIFLPEELARRVRLVFLQPGVAMAGMLFVYFFGGRLIWPAAMWAMRILLS
jgi:Zn-dependent protease